jgi:hypothetical protein
MSVATRAGLSLSACLRSIANGLLRITNHCWDIACPEKARREDHKLDNQEWYLRVSEFRENPCLAIRALYERHALEAALVWLQVHHSVELAKEVERRLCTPLETLARLSFRALQILDGDLEGENETTTVRRYPFDRLNELASFEGEGTPEYAAAVPVLDRWYEIQLKLRVAAEYLQRLTAVLSATPTQTVKPTVKSEMKSETPKKNHRPTSETLRNAAYIDRRRGAKTTVDEAIRELLEKRPENVADPDKEYQRIRRNYFNYKLRQKQETSET